MAAITAVCISHSMWYDGLIFKLLQKSFSLSCQPLDL